MRGILQGIEMIEKLMNYKNVHINKGKGFQKPSTLDLFTQVTGSSTVNIFFLLALDDSTSFLFFFIFVMLVGSFKNHLNYFS